MNYSKVVNACQELLFLSPGSKALEYLENRLDLNTIKEFQFGYFPKSEEINLFSNFLKEEELIELDLLYDRVLWENGENKKERHLALENHNLLLPYCNCYGDPIALVGRCLLNEIEMRNYSIPKYKNTSFKKKDHLFGLNLAREEILKKRFVMIVEGQFDCISLMKNGMKNTVALGSSGMSFEQLALLKRYTENFVLLLDNDLAGQKGAERILKLFGDFGKFKVIELPEGYKDVDEFLKENAVEDLRELMK